MAAQVASPPLQQPLWFATSSPTYPRPPSRLSFRPEPNTEIPDGTTRTRASVFDGGVAASPYYSSQQWQQQQRMSTYQEQQQQQQTTEEGEQEKESSGASTPESRESSGWRADAGNGVVAGTMPAEKSNRKAWRKLMRLVKKRAKEIVIITVFNSDGEILCSLTGAQAGQEHTYQPSSDEGKYLLLALERGFKKEGCEFDFGGTLWLSGQQDEVDEKKTLLGNESTGEFRHHRFYSVLSPTGRYVVAAVLKEGTGGQLDAKLLRKIRTTADNFEVYEAWAGSGKLMAKLACAA